MDSNVPAILAPEVGSYRLACQSVLVAGFNPIGILWYHYIRSHKISIHASTLLKQGVASLTQVALRGTGVCAGAGVSNPVELVKGVSSPPPGTEHLICQQSLETITIFREGFRSEVCTALGEG